jgi:nitrate reductase NapE component
MSVARRALLVVFATGFCFCIWMNVVIQMNYTKSMPHDPQPETGRTYLYEVNHDAYRYLNKRELERAKFAQFGLYPLALVCFLGLGAVKVCDW